MHFFCLKLGGKFDDTFLISMHILNLINFFLKCGCFRRIFNLKTFFAKIPICRLSTKLFKSLSDRFTGAPSEKGPILMMRIMVMMRMKIVFMMAVMLLTMMTMMTMMTIVLTTHWDWACAAQVASPEREPWWEESCFGTWTSSWSWISLSILTSSKVVLSGEN